MRAEAILTGRLRAPEAYILRPQPRARAITALRPGAPAVRLACLAFAVRHPGAGTILVDTGFHADAATALRRDFGLPMSVLFGGLRPAAEPFDAQLRHLGIDPAEVSRVVMTHLHVDHTSGMRLLPRAEFTCAREEWAAAHGRWAAGRGFVAGHLPERGRVRLVDFAAEGEPFSPFARTLDLLGDGSVRLVSTPGHTPGHLSVLLAAGDRPVLLVGDAAYTRRNVTEQRLPLLTADDGLAARSLGEIAAYREQEPGALLVPSHDPDAWRALEGP